MALPVRGSYLYSPGSCERKTERLTPPAWSAVEWVLADPLFGTVAFQLRGKWSRVPIDSCRTIFLLHHTFSCASRPHPGCVEAWRAWKPTSRVPRRAETAAGASWRTLWACTDRIRSSACTSRATLADQTLCWWIWICPVDLLFSIIQHFITTPAFLIDFWVFINLVIFLINFLLNKSALNIINPPYLVTFCWSDAVASECWITFYNSTFLFFYILFILFNLFLLNKKIYTYFNVLLIVLCFNYFSCLFFKYNLFLFFIIICLLFNNYLF